MFLSGLLGSGGHTEPQEEDGLSLVERIVDRIDAASMLADRREACKNLRELARTYRVHVGAKGMPSLIRILDQDRNDLEMINLALETLAEIICQQDQLGEQFTEIFIKDNANVGLLLDIIEEHDFSVRWSAIKLLSGLVLHQTKQMQNAVLSSMMGISRLMDLLVDNREVIRNDALLMLTQLTKSNANIQKIVAFESAFDRLLDIITSEGFADGGIVVEDSLNIMLNLLHNNISNLNLFKEGPYIARLVDFFNDLNSVTSEWSSGKVNNVLVMYKVIRCLVSPNNPNNVTSSCQSSLRRTGLLSVLSETLMASGVPAHVLWETINTVAEVIRGCPENQSVFKEVQAPSNPPTSALVILLMSMLNEKQPLDLRCAILYCFESYIHGNRATQQQLIESFDSCTEGKLLRQGLTSKDPMSNWLASMAISCVIAETKNLDGIMAEVAASLKQPTCPNQSKIGYLILLATWLSGSEANVSKFVDATENVSNLTSELCLPANEQSEAIVQSLSAIILSLCIVFNNDSVDAFNKVTLRSLIVNRVGKETFLEKLTTLSKQPCYTAAVRSPQVSADQTILNHAFCTMYRGVENMAQKCLDENDVQQQQIDELKRTIRQQETLINQLRNSNSSQLTTAMPSLVPTFHMDPTTSLQAGPPVQMVTPVFGKNYYDELQKAKMRIAELEAELQQKSSCCDDLLLLVAEQEKQIEDLEIRLRSLSHPQGDFTSDTLNGNHVDHLSSNISNLHIDPQSGGYLPPVVMVPPMIPQNPQPIQSYPDYLPQPPMHSVEPSMQANVYEYEVSAVNSAPQLVDSRQLTQMSQIVDTPAIQAISSVVPAPIAQTAEVSDIRASQPLVMSSADTTSLQNSVGHSQFVQFYNPAAMFQPVSLPETPAMYSDQQPPRPPSSTVSSSAAELSGGNRQDTDQDSLTSSFYNVM